MADANTVAAVVAESVRVRHYGAEQCTPSGVSLRVAPGEVLLVLGPSGCGKSTLALTLNGLVPHAVAADLEGTVTVGGADTVAHPVARLSEHVAMVFQNPEAQLVTTSVLDEVCFGPENRLVPADEVESRAEAVLRRVGLWERRGDDPGTLSGGGQQRLAIAAALAMESPLLVLDEPTANLDPAGAEDLYRLIAQLAGPGSDRAVVLIEHNLDLALDVADTLLVLGHDGRPVAMGPARQLVRERAEELAESGVWLPTATLAALRMRRAGIRLEPLPLSARELTDALASADLSTAPPRIAPAEPISSPSTAAVITASRLTVRRGRREILHDVSLTVNRGEFVAVVGRNGAGKSTLVQALAGVVRPPRSTVELCGIDPARASARAIRSVVGFVYQNPEHQFVASTVADELAYGLRQRGLPDAEVEQRVERMLTVLGLEAQRSSHPFRLSGGQQRRLSVGTAVIESPPVLVLDEPTYGLDRARALELLGLLTELNARGTTVIVVTHDLGLAAEYASRLVVVDDGRIVAQGAPAAILREDELLESHGLRAPALVTALAPAEVPEVFRGLTRLRELPGDEARQSAGPL